jgi:molecular chaperone GrpE (heat shock protein)
MKRKELTLSVSMTPDPDGLEGLMECLAEEVALRLAQDQSAQETWRKQVVYSMDGLKKDLEKLGHDQDVLSRTLETQQTLSPQLYDHQIIEPMVRGLFPVVDMIQGTLRISDSQRFSDLVKGIKTQLSQFLATFGIELFCHKTEQRFDPKVMKPLKRITTYDRGLDGLIAESLQCGFKNSDRLLRLESVSIYQYQPTIMKEMTHGNDRN